MSRLIDADELQKLFNETTTSLMDKIDLKSVEHLVRACIMVTQMIHDAPTIEAEPVRRGHWDADADGYADGEFVYDHWFCSECGWDDSGFLEEKPNYKYCPYCGARMEDNE